MNTPNKQAELESKYVCTCPNCKYQHNVSAFLVDLLENKNKAQTLADVMKLVEAVEGSQAETAWFDFNEALAKLQSPQKKSPDCVNSLVTEGSSEDTIQKAISEFKEKLEKEINLHAEHNSFGEQVRQMLISFIEKTAQEITG